MKNLEVYEKLGIGALILALVFIGCIIVNQFNEIKPLVAIIAWISILLSIFAIIWFGFSISKERGEQQRIKDYNELREGAIVDALGKHYAKAEKDAFKDFKTMRITMEQRPEHIIISSDPCENFNPNSELCQICPFK